MPKRAQLEWSIRPFPGFDRAAWDRDVAALLPPGVELSTTIDHPPFSCDTLAPLVAAPAVALDFWTEAALLAEHGIAAIVIGPGDIAQAHAADEYVALADLDWAIELYRGLLRG